MADLTENPLLTPIHAQQRAELVERFPELEHCASGDYLALHRYLQQTPERFFSECDYEQMLTWLTTRDASARTELQAYLADDANRHALNQAFLHLAEINALDWHDEILEGLDDYEQLQVLDANVHPTYQRVVEAVFQPLLLMVAHFSRLDRRKGTDGLNVFNVVAELRGQALESATGGYRPIIRNGIAHGGITYCEGRIRYRDSRGNEEELAASEIVHLLDDLLDSCNALALALSVFLLSRQSDYSVFEQILLAELTAQTEAPWWRVVGSIATEAMDQAQLIVYVRPRTSDFNKVMFSALQSGVLAERLAPGYDRYFFSIRSEDSWAGWAAFQGEKLRDARLAGDAAGVERYQDIFEHFFFVPKVKLPGFVYKVQNLVHAVRLQAPRSLAEYRQQLGLATTTVRDAQIHRNSWGSVLRGKVVLEAPSGRVTQALVRESCGRVVRSVLKEARKLASITERHLPLGFALIHVYQQDHRRRHLAAYGLGPDLVCTVRMQRIRRIQCPDILGSTVEQVGSYRIAWNRAWLEEQGNIP